MGLVSFNYFQQHGNGLAAFSAENELITSPSTSVLCNYTRALEFLARPDTNDRGLQARPDTLDQNFQVRPNSKVVGSNTDLTIPPEKTAMDTEDQVDLRAWIKGLFIENPNWVALRIQPIRGKSGKDDPRYRLGVKGSLISIIGDKKRYNYETIDWVATESKIRDIYNDGESNSIDEVGSMRGEENPLVRQDWAESLGFQQRNYIQRTQSRQLPWARA
ncbi:unnamed protein product [Phytophthora lilii]|uniref:Unnamed protein product n=1 Tax=Phytophthora lilii TaxID=2077276 RepID=A0A9W6UE80_9STRA|nr:unnamed protein product [Phytophthora lilii]